MRWALIVLAAGCVQKPDPEGTAVGNPGNAQLDASALPDDATLARAEATVTRIDLRGCDGAAERITVGTSADLLGPDGPIAVPGGRWCGVWVHLDWLLLEGVTAGGTTFAVEIAPDTLAIDGPVTVDGDDLLVGLDLAAWFDAAELEALGADVVVMPGDALAQAWAEAADGQLDLYLDEDGDGAVDDLDPLVGQGIPFDADQDYPGYAADGASGCGCGTGAAGGGGAMVALIALLGLRRRRCVR